MERVDKDSKTFLRQIIETEVIARAKDGVYLPDFPRDEKGWLMDFKKVLLRPDVLRACLDLFWKNMDTHYPFQVGGLEIAAVPLIGAIVADSTRKESLGPVNGFFIRKERKPLGLQKFIEGEVLPDVPIVLVDDIVNRGLSVESQIEILERSGHKVSKLFTIIRFRDASYYEALKAKGIEIHSLFELNDFTSGTGLENITLRTSEPPTRPFEVRWYFKNKDPRHEFVLPKSAPVLDTDKVYFGSDDGTFFALDQETGAKRWQYRIMFGSGEKRIFSSPCISEEIVFFGAYDGNVYALDAKTGARRWVYFDADWVGSSPCVAEDLGLLYIGLEYGLLTKQGGICALDIKTGKEVWKQYVPALVHASPGYSAKHRIVICGCNDGIARAFDAKSGKEVWSVKTGAPVRFGVAFDDRNNLAIFGSEDGGVYFVDISTGVVRYTFHTKAGVYSTPLVINDLVYVSSLDKYIYCIDSKTGQEVWNFQTAGRIFATPKLIGDSILVGSNDGRLYELNATTGANTAIFFATERIVNQIAYNEKTGRIYLPTAANELYCLHRR